MTHYLVKIYWKKSVAKCQFKDIFSATKYIHDYTEFFDSEKLQQIKKIEVSKIDS